jgi:hypothetical protein
LQDDSCGEALGIVLRFGRAQSCALGIVVIGKAKIVAFPLASWRTKSMRAEQGADEISGFAEGAASPGGGRVAVQASRVLLTMGTVSLQPPSVQGFVRVVGDGVSQ